MASQDPRHSDNFARGELSTAEPVAEAGVRAGRTVNNAGAAAAADRQRQYTAGGDDGTATAPAGAPAAPPRPLLVAAATARMRAPDRPSPFGVAQFPPIPLPFGMAKPRTGSGAGKP